jgi:hypothetical protein
MKSKSSLRLAFLAALAVAFAAACSSSDSDSGSASAGDAGAGEGGDGSGEEGGGGEPPTSPPPSESVCSLPDECVAVSSICCECPTFAVAADSPFAEACDQVDCDPPQDCPQVEAACVESQCQLICSTIEATMVCPNGFERDTFGCLIDSCRDDPGEFFSCQEDGDCTEVPADCCGCKRGGANTAVAVELVDAYIESLDCKPDPSCPDVNVCESGLVPRCVAQTCTLGPTGDGGDDGDDGSGEPENFCGTPDLPTCPRGQVCVLNHPDAGDATRMAVGSCVPVDEIEPPGMP